MTLAMSGATEEDAGLASGFINTTTEVGAALGLAVLATLSATRTEHLVGGGPVTRSALTSGYQLAFVIAAVLSVAALVVAVVVLRSDKQPADEPVAAEQGGCRTEPCGCPA
jgi:sugar phosphate permease